MSKKRERVWKKKPRIQAADTPQRTNTAEQKKGMDFRQSTGLLLRGFREANRISPHVFLYAAFYGIVFALPPFFNIYFPAKIISELMGEQDIGRLALYVGLSIGLYFLCKAFEAWMDKRMNLATNFLYYRSDQLITRLFLTMDFDKLEDPAFQELYHKYQEASRSNRGCVLNNLVWWFYSLVTGLTSVVGAAFLVAPLVKLSFQGDWHGGFVQSPWFAILILASVLAVVVFVLLMSGKMNSKWYELTDRYAAVNRLFRFYLKLTSDYKTGKEIRVYNEQKLIEHDATDRVWREGVQIEQALARASGVSSVSIAVVGAVIGCGIYLFIGLKGLFGLFDIGNLVRYTGSFMQVLNGVTALATTTGQLNQFIPQMRYYFDLIDTKPTKQKGTLPVEKPADGAYEIEFRDVSFRYPGTESYALKNFSIQLRVGRRLAVVGMNGSGKTTFIKLLCRLYDPTEGEILLNGVDIRQYSEQEYQKLFSVVFQDFNLFSFTLGQNVAARTEYDGRDVRRCLEEAGIGDRVNQLPKGLETPLYKDFDEEGVEISGGEAQKIALARALYKQSPFIVLDEPTAALDPIAEFDIYSRFNEIVKDKTAIYISHRLSSCRFCDDIAVFHEGEMIQRGSHEELLRDEAGKYYALWFAQAQYYDKKTRAELNV